MPQRGPVRAFTPEQEAIADGIRRGLTYEQIGHEIGKSAYTVADRVEKMAFLFDCYHEYHEEDRLKPRDIVLVYAIYKHLGNQAMEKAEQHAKTRLMQKVLS